MKTILFLLTLSLFLTCGSSDKLSADRKVITSIKLDEKDSGRILQVSLEDILEISLEANPTTGYQWDITSIDTIILQKIFEKYISRKVAENIVGSGGKSIFTFKSIKKGETSLKIIYHRSFEKNVEPQNEFKLIVVVK